MLQSCTNYKDHKDTLKGHIDSFYSLSFPSFIKECGLKKAPFGNTEVALSWPEQADEHKCGHDDCQLVTDIGNAPGFSASKH